MTFPADISPLFASNRGIVAESQDAAGNPQFFLDNNGSYTPLQFPGLNSNFITIDGLDNAGDILFTYSKQGPALAPGFYVLSTDGSYSAILFPGATKTTVTGITTNGNLFGSYYVGSKEASFEALLSSAPEPSTCALLGGGLLMLMFTQRKIRKQRVRATTSVHPQSRHMS